MNIINVEKMKFEILNGRGTLNNWFTFVFLVCNYLLIELTILGYGFRFELRLKEATVDSIKVTDI